MELKEKIVYTIANELCEDILKEMNNKYFGAYGYVFADYYSRKIKELFRENKIPFKTIYDVKRDELSQPQNNLSSKLVESYKETLYSGFLCEILPVEKQKKLLLKVLEKMDFSDVFNTYQGKSSVLDIFNNFKDVGLDCKYISKEFEEKLFLVFDNYHIGDFVLTMIFSVQRGMFFKEENIREVFDRLNANADQLYISKRFDEVLKQNKQSESIFNYKVLKESGVSKIKRLEKRAKI